MITKKYGKEWKIAKSRNFICYYTKKSIAKSDIKKMEDHLKKLKKLFSVKFNKKIEIFSVKNRKEMKEIIGYETVGRADLKNNRIFSIFVFHPHELTHIVASKIFKKANFLFGGGLGVAFGWPEGWHGKSLEFWVKEFIKTKQYISIKKLLDDSIYRKTDQKLSYPISGAFVRFLIKKYGIKKFILICKRIKYEDDPKISERKFFEIYKKSLDDLEKEFKVFFS